RCGARTGDDRHARRTRGGIQPRLRRAGDAVGAHADDRAVDGVPGNRDRSDRAIVSRRYAALVCRRLEDPHDRVRPGDRSGERSAVDDRLAGRATRAGGGAMTSERPEIVYVLPDKLGGVFSYVENLLAHRRDDGCDYAAILTDNLIEPD